MKAGRKGALILALVLAVVTGLTSVPAAIAAGADAIYLSGKRFGARKYAANFSDAEIVDAVRLAHTRGVRVYVTVNTLVQDAELEAAAETLAALAELGVDAVIVQDLGLVRLARERLPGLRLHASTQMAVHNRPGAELARAGEANIWRHCPKQ